jgi:hypothetical protein
MPNQKISKNSRPHLRQRLRPRWNHHCLNQQKSGISHIPKTVVFCIAHEDPAIRVRVPIHLVQSLTVPDGSAMCRVYTDYLYAARQMVLSGHPLNQFLGPNDDIIVDLLFRQRHGDDRWDCSSWACELFRSFTEYDVYVKLANAFFLTRMMKVCFDLTFLLR